MQVNLLVLLSLSKLASSNSSYTVEANVTLNILSIKQVMAALWGHAHHNSQIVVFIQIIFNMLFNTSCIEFDHSIYVVIT